MIFQLSYLLLILTLVMALSIAVRGRTPRYLTILFSAIVFIFVVVNNMTMTNFYYGTLSILTLSFQLNFVSSILLILISFIGIFIPLRYSSSPGFFVLLQFLLFSLIGIFTTRDFIVFYIFWEMVLIPSFFVIGIWGGANKNYAAMKFFIYTHVGSVFMLLGIFTMYFTEGASNFSMSTLISGIGSVPIAYQAFVIFGFLFAFLIKLPTIPLHSWLPDAYVEAPSEGTVFISSLLSKMGAFGLLVIFSPVFMASSFAGSTAVPIALMVLGVFSLTYSALVALYQKDVKRMMSYTSIGHMSFITIAVGGFLYLNGSNPLASQLLYYGAVFQLISHGIIIAMIFALVDTLEKATGTRQIPSLGGIARKLPGLSFLILAAFLASVAIPGFSGFVGEISILLGSYAVLKYYIIFVLIGVVLTASYHIFALQRTIFGPYNEFLGNISAKKQELLVALFPLALIFLLGIYPALIFHTFNIHVIQFLGGIH
ncbi:MAG: NADH-quinone oxidoreductase subunit M [Thermoplasmatales archaeon]